MTYTEEQIAAAVEVAEAEHAYHEYIGERCKAMARIDAAIDSEAREVERAKLVALDNYEKFIGPLCRRQERAREQWAKVRPA